MPYQLSAGRVLDRRFALEDRDERIAAIADAEQDVADRRGALLTVLREQRELALRQHLDRRDRHRHEPSERLCRARPGGAAADAAPRDRGPARARGGMRRGPRPCARGGAATRRAWSAGSGSRRARAVRRSPAPPRDRATRRPRRPCSARRRASRSGGRARRRARRSAASREESSACNDAIAAWTT